MAGATYEVPALALALLPQSDKIRSKDYAAYSLEWLPINAGLANVQQQFQIDSNTDFVGLFLTGNVTDTAAPPVEDAAPQFTLQFKMADRTVFDKNVHWRQVIGSAVSPFPLPFPWWLSRASTLTAFLTSLTNVNRNVRITVHGFILHTYGASTSRGY
jgi:hypothetical protein